MLIIFNTKPDLYGNRIKIIKSGAAFIIPALASYVIFDLSPFTININNGQFHDKEGSLIKINAKFILAISTDELVIEHAFERISGLPREQISNLAKELIESDLRSFISENTGLDKLQNNDFKNQLFQSIKEPLEDIGLMIMNVDLVEVKRE